MIRRPYVLLLLAPELRFVDSAVSSLRVLVWGSMWMDEDEEYACRYERVDVGVRM